VYEILYEEQKMRSKKLGSFKCCPWVSQNPLQTKPLDRPPAQQIERGGVLRHLKNGLMTNIVS
jgi:hypothetical protein